jgi:hypothetical protein
MSDATPDWIDAQKTADEALDTARKAMASERANLHITMLILATLAKTAPKDAVEKLHAEFERIRDLSGPRARSPTRSSPPRCPPRALRRRD